LTFDHEIISQVGVTLPNETELKPIPVADESDPKVKYLAFSREQQEQFADSQKNPDRKKVSDGKEAAAMPGVRYRRWDGIEGTTIAEFKAGLVFHHSTALATLW
jgi:hypothetical protein